MADAVVSVGVRKVILSGTVISERSKPVTISFRGLTLEFHFLYEKGSAPGFKSEQVDSKSLKINLTNFDSAVGFAWDSVVGELESQPLVMALVIHTLGYNEDGSGRVQLMNYTFSVGNDYVG